MGKFDDHPFLAIWETTQACDLACRHCRAAARPNRDPAELDTDEAKRLLDGFARAEVPLVVLTGGDPAKRSDLVELVAYARSLGLVVGLTPSATPAVTPRLVTALARAGLSRLAVSIDAPSASAHDAFRGAPGSFELSLRILANARDEGISTQVNSSVDVSNLAGLADLARLVRRTEAALWSVFFVVPMGRAVGTVAPSAAAIERALQEIAEIAEREPFSVKTTAAPHYRRVLFERKKRTGIEAANGANGAQGLRVNDGRGFLFVSHRGAVYPSGFLPIDCGNVRAKDPIAIYRDHPVFRALRNSELYRGKCGACEYRQICGGSRSRAYARTGDFLESDDLCAYVPPGYAEAEHSKRWLRVVNG